jgi:hypothetical protein
MKDTDMPDNYFAIATWKSLPIETRREWWHDTLYGTRPPSRELCERLMRDLKIVIRGPMRDADRPNQSD